ncbi:hypothetical protein [Acinetobacter haemolyticus]|uniref:hypothetical protein n=1 Tax=Acinetobacter haemolyticus TaxID=29430 RepID=UPI00148ED12B|nr:hypothetical protein [Acinetobacter haemolyticus]
MLFKSLLSPIKSITSSLIDSNTSSASTSALAPLSLSTITNIISPTTVTNTISSITNDIDNNPLNTVTSIVGGSSGGLLSPITGIIGGISSGGDGGLLSPITGIIGGISGGGDGGLLSPITGIIGGISGGGDGGLLSPITGIIGGIGGGDLGNNPVTGVIQTGIDILQGAESLKTTIINTGINTAADTILGVFPQAEHPVSDLANLGTLTFETSRDTVNGTLEAISDLAGASFGGALSNATGVVGTLINNGSTAAGIIQHVIGEDILGGGIIGGIGGGDGGLLSPITGIIGGIGGIGGDGSPLDLITGIIGGIGGGDGGSPLDILTGIIGGIGGGDLGNNPITGVIQTGIDILQGVESLKTDLINTGINTVADAIIGVFPQAEHPVSDLANLGTLTFETSRDTVNGTLEAISDLAGANFGGALGNATGVIGTLINNGSTAAGIIQHVIGEDILGGGIIGGIGGGDGGLLSPITGIIGGIGGIGGDGSPLDLITGIIGGIGGGDGGSPLDILTGIIGGIGGGDLGNNPITGVIQTGIDILQGVESLKTDLINTGINTVADAIIGVFPQAEHPVSDLANLGTLTFETSRDTVNGTLEAISDLAGADFGGALGNATGVIGTLINNGSTAADIIQHIVGDDLLGGGILGSIGGGIGGDGGLLSPITGILGGDILGNLGGLLSINVGDNCGCTSSNGGVDSILDSVLGAASSSQILSASGSTTNFTDNLSIPSLNLSEQLFESTNLF